MATKALYNSYHATDPNGMIRGGILVGGKVFAGNPTAAQIASVSPGTILGATIQTDFEGNARVTMDGSGITTYDSANQKEGWAINPHSGGVAGALDYYVNNAKKATFGRGGAGDSTFVFNYTDGHFNVQLGGGARFMYNGSELATRDWVEQKIQEAKNSMQ